MKRSEILSFLILIVCVVCSACSRYKKTEKETIRTVKTDTVRVYNYSAKSSFPGKIKADSEIGVSFRIAGTIAQINVEEGAFVKKGQTLALLDARDYEIQLAATEAEYRQIKAEADRIIELHKTGSVTDNDYDKAVYGLQQITAKYNAHRNALADTRLAAPFNGYVQKRYFESGETVGAGMPVLSVIDAGAPEVEINIPASEYVKQNLFDSFSCAVDIFPEKSFPLDLIGITRKANMNQLYTVRLKMRNTNAPLPSPGMATMVSITYKPEKTSQAQIPYSALFEQNSLSAVWIYNPENQTVSAKTIKIAEIRSDGTVIVSEGLSAGEIIVTAGVNSLKEGEKVKLLPTPSASNIGFVL
jgi:RND family efflux transporter MFP subunit